MNGKIKRSVALVVLLLIPAGVFFIVRSFTGKREADYNVILISLDTLSAGHVGAYGYQRETTPHIDELAKNAVLFENVYAQSPNTAISHATMLTSLHPMVHGTNPEYILGDEFETLAEHFQKSGYKTGGFTTHGAWLDRRMGFAQGFDDFFSDFIRAPEINEYAFKFLKENAGERFFLFVHYYDIHSDYHKLPYETGTDYDRKFCAGYTGDFTGCKNDSCASTFLDKVNSEGWTIPAQDLEYITALYDGGIAYTDHHVNRLFDYLKKLGVFENSLIIITSDHGEEFMEHGKVLHLQIYNEVMRVPLIVKLPGKKEHARITNPLGLIDLMPTILDMAGIRYKNLQGKSFLPVINGKEELDRPVFSTLCGLKPEG
ncbi:MAG: sulfatase, partial [bacterium]|nr:sulfatase [bacterium]